LKHQTAASFWALYSELSPNARRLADKQFRILEANSTHPSLHFKRVGKYWSARVDQDHRAVALKVETGFMWFWIGTHADYERLIR
jgi:hypothetical protein